MTLPFLPLFAFVVIPNMGKKAELKGICGDGQLDIARYGRQKRHDPARSGNGGLPPSV
jgi:hypothetical protein